MKSRLNAHARSQLIDFAKSVIACPVEANALDAAYKRAAELVRKTVENKLPPKDMKILQKYDKAHVDDCIRLTGPGIRFEVFNFIKGTGPLSIGCRTFLADDATAEAVLAWIAARTAYRKAMDAKERDYRALINTSRIFEDVLEVWPEAEQMRDRLNVNAIAPFAADVAARIRADVASRAHAEAA